MSHLFINLILLITTCLGYYICCGNQNMGNITANEASVPDTAEFNSVEQKKINRFNDSNYRAVFKEELIAFRQERKNYTESALINATGKYFFNFFGCAVSTMKTTLERNYKIIENLPLRPPSENVEYPTEFQNLNATHDRWLDLKFSGRSQKLTTSPTTQIYRVYKIWYNFLTTSLRFVHGERFDILVHIRSRLNEIRLNDTIKYPDLDTAYKRFSAIASRSFRIMCGLHYDVEPFIIGLAHTYPRLWFSQLLFRMVKTWHFTGEDVLFINILVELKKKKRNSIMFTEVMNPLNETVAIPFESFETCVSQPMQNSFILPYTRANDYEYND